MRKYLVRHNAGKRHIQLEAALPVCVGCGAKTCGHGSDPKGGIYCGSCWSAYRLSLKNDCVGCSKKDMSNVSRHDFNLAGRVMCNRCYEQEKIKTLSKDPNMMAKMIFDLMYENVMLKDRVDDLENRGTW